jgi:hypothetical protein
MQGFFNSTVKIIEFCQNSANSDRKQGFCREFSRIAGSLLKQKS